MVPRANTSNMNANDAILNDASNTAVIDHEIAAYSPGIDVDVELANEGDDDLSLDGEDEVDAGPSLQSFVEDDSKVPPAKRMTYIMMLCLGNIEGFNPQEDHPYSEFVNRSGFKSRFKPTKGLIVQEMKRRDRNAKPNTSNNSVDQLIRRLDPFEDGADKEYVVRMEGEYRQQLLNQLQQENEEAENSTPRAYQRPDDRIRFALLFGEEEIYEAYMQSQNCLLRPEIDAGMSGAGTNFLAMAVAYLNEHDWIPEAEALPSLHSDFAFRRAVPRAEYEWTPEKVKKHLSEVRRNLTEMVRKYEISGNGSNQATHDDSDNEDVEENEETWGRFNAERARRVAERRYGNEESETNSGDDRANYLRHLPVDWLYTWDAFDKHAIIHFTCVRLALGHSASSHDTPLPTARPRTNRSNDQLARNQRDMVMSVQDIGASIADMSRANAEMGRAAKIRRIDELRSERYRVTVAKARATTDGEGAAHQSYIDDLTLRIDAATSEVDSDQSSAAGSPSAANASTS